MKGWEKAKTKGRVSLRRLSYRWHRRVGVVSAILVIILAITGILLSHADGFRLYETHISASWLPQSYAPTPKNPLRSFPTDAGWAVWIDGVLYHNSDMITSTMPALVGAVAHDNQFIVAGDTELALFHLPDGQLVDRLGPAALPGPITRLGLTENNAIAIETTDGVFSSPDLLLWHITNNKVTWSKAHPLPDGIEDNILKLYGGGAIPLHRIIADIHSGRIFGSAGPWIMDAAAIALLILSLTGFYQWFHRRNGRKTKDR